MFDYLLAQYIELMALTKDNPIMGGAVFATVFGTAWYTLKDALIKIPGYLFNQIVKHTTINFDLMDDSRTQNEVVFNNFLKWYSGTKYFEYSKNFRIAREWRKNVCHYDVVPGDGFHWFRIGWRLGWFTRSMTENTGTTVQLQKIRITIMSFNKDFALDFVAMFKDADVVPEDVMHVANWRGNCRQQHLRTEDSYVSRNNIHHQIIKDIENFLKEEQWYLKHGIPYRLGIVLEGPPGTGKTSLAKLLASKLKLILATGNISELSDDDLVAAVENQATNSIIFLEDIDAALGKTIQKRDRKVKTVELTAYNPDVPELGECETITESNTNKFTQTITLSGLLNVLDGANTPHGSIFILTTNHVSHLDSALLRPGRIDHIYHIGELSDTEIRQYIQLSFPDVTISTDFTFADITGARLQSLLLRHKHDAQAFINSIPKLTHLNHLETQLAMKTFTTVYVNRG